VTEDEGIPTAVYLAEATEDHPRMNPGRIVDTNDSLPPAISDNDGFTTTEAVRRQDILDLIEELRQKKVEKPEQAKSIHFNIGFGKALDKLKKGVEQQE